MFYIESQKSRKSDMICESEKKAHIIGKKDHFSLPLIVITKPALRISTPVQIAEYRQHYAFLT